MRCRRWTPASSAGVVTLRPAFLNKGMQVLVLALSGAMPRLAGYVDTSVPPSIEQLERMKVLLYSTDIVGVLLALVLLWVCSVATADRFARS